MSMRMGGVFAHQVTPSEKRICQVVKSKLIADGLYFVGLDIIADKLVEINCVSPGGIPRINRLDNTHLERQVIDFLEKKADKINRVPHRKRA